MRTNEFGQSIGEALPGFTPGGKPDIRILEGKEVRVEKLDVHHLDELYAVYGPESPLENWTYLPMNPFTEEGAYRDYMATLVASDDPYYLVVINKKDNKPVGTFALMRHDLANRVIEMGWVIYSNALQRTRMATEAQFLVMQYVFETLQYRRYEWKCDHLNQASRGAALRLGFTYEGTFRQAAVYKGRSRDTDWFSLLDSEWPRQKQRLLTWLSEDNFTETGEQKRSLREIEE